MGKWGFAICLLALTSAPVWAQPQQPGAEPPQESAGEGAPVTFRNFRDASMFDLIDVIARRLGINYLIDPAVQDGTITINTYGQLSESDLLPLLETILRMNGAVAVQVGGLYHVVPLEGVAQQPILPHLDAAENLPQDERMILNAVRLSFMSAGELADVLAPFLGRGAQYQVVPQTNTLLILDNARSMRRTMELLRLFDTPEMATQRIRLFEVKNNMASSIANELQSIFGAFAAPGSASTPAARTGGGVQFVPLDRINSLLVVSSTPQVFEQVSEWLEKLDTAVTSSGVQNFVYKVQYGSARNLAGTLLQLYGFGYGMGMGMGMGYEYGGGYGYGGGGYGMAPGATQFRDADLPLGVGGSPGMYGGYGGGMGYGGGGGVIRLPGTAYQQPVRPPPTAEGDQTGARLGEAAAADEAAAARGIRIVPDLVNNLIVVQSTQQEWEILRKTLQQLDFPPRQVLIDAKVYEVSLSGALNSGVSAFLRNRDDESGQRKLTGGFDVDGAVELTIGALVGNTRELVAFLQASQTEGKTRIISAPSVVATDNIAATITVGQSIPTLASQGIAGGAQADGDSLFTNTITNVQTGVTLAITARVNASGIVTMEVDQEVSSPQPPTGPIASPTIDRRNVSTQITVGDGDTVAIGGIIQELNQYAQNRVPFLGKIPILGAVFGGTRSSRAKTELIVTLTPRVIYDENELTSASAELANRLRSVRRLMRQ